jgi:uncharacterized protein YegP (UPF0339 family)
MSQHIVREKMTITSRWRVSIGVSVVAATVGLSQSATAQVNPATIVAQRTITVDAEVVSPQESAESFGTMIEVSPPSELFQPRPSAQKLKFPRLSLSDILVLEPNLDPEKPHPTYGQTVSQLPDEGYKVVVEAKDATQEERIRALIPQAFRTQHNGQIMLQVGLFRDRANAEQVLQSLNSNGLQAIIVNL